MNAKAKAVLPWKRRAAATAALALTLVAAVAGGCAAIDHEPAKLDSPQAWPSPSASSAGAGSALQADAARGDPVCARDESGRPRLLAAGSSCYAVVRAAEWFSTANVSVQPGCIVTVTVPPRQYWYDANRVNVAPLGDDGSGLMKLFGGLKRDKEEPYFALMAAVVSCAPDAGSKPGFRRCTKVPGGQPAQISKIPHDLEVTAAGELAFYANDAALPWLWKDLFYKNNEGQIWVQLTMNRCESK